MAAWANIKKSLYYWKRNGWKRTFYAVSERAAERKTAAYRYVPPAEEALAEQRRKCGELSKEEAPLFSILVPTYRTKEIFLKELTEALQAQTYPFWQLVIADATEDDSVGRVMEGVSDDRVTYVKLGENGGISQNSNQGLMHVKGDYVGLLDHDDLLTPDALYEMYEAVQKGKNKGIEAELLYSDEDKCDAGGEAYYEPNRKEDFNYDMLLSNNYICHFMVMRTALIKQLGFRKTFDGAQDYDLVLRAVGKLLGSGDADNKITHVPKVLYHWRCHGESTAENPRSKDYAYRAGRLALQEFADGQKMGAKAVDLPHLGFYRLVCEKESIFACRPDLGAVGGKLLHGGKIAGGRMDETGAVFYEGLPKGYSGTLHRAALTQNCLAADIRLIRVREECHALFKEAVGVSYRTIPGTDIFDAETLPAGTDCKEASLALGRALREAGYRILWDPQFVKEI